MKKNKGFTLVELLAVIVILAVVSIIAIPIIINMIEEAKKGALKDSVEGLTKAADMYYFQNMKNTEEGVQIEIINNEQTAPTEPKLNYKGEVKNGFVLISYDGKVAVCVDDGKYYASRALDTKSIVADNGTCTNEFDEDLQSFVTVGSANYVGTKLNIKAYKNKEALPKSATPGSFGVITEQKISNYFVSPFAPSEPKEGMVWVVQSSEAEVFVNTKNSQTGVAYTLQYENGKWELRDSWVYNEEWVQVKAYNNSDYEWNFEYKGYYEEFEAPYSGYYTIELWGAAGGSYSTTWYGGKGAYTKGDLYLNKGEIIYVYVGGKGAKGNNNAGGWNGGGTGYNTNGFGGGGSTDIRTVPTSKNTIWNETPSLLSRIMVAAGAGGASVYDTGTWPATGGDAGGLNSYVGTGGSNAAKWTGSVATQRWAGQPSPVSYPGYAGGFGYGGNGRQGDTNGGGGGGWFGGAGSSHAGGFNSGGSSYISGHEGCISVDGSQYSTGGVLSNTGKYFMNTLMIDGKGYKWTDKVETYTGMPTIENSKITMTGNNADGYARISLSNFDSLTEEKYEQIRQSIQNVWEYDYMGYYQQFTSSKAGTYKFELWGAQGGTYDSSWYGGYGAYTSGEITLKKGQTLYIYVGSQGKASGVPGWNGGGTGYNTNGFGGGGSTDIRTLSTPTLTTWNETASLLSRIMVAGAGGGASVYDTGTWPATGGPAGGLNSYTGTGGSNAVKWTGTVATQTLAGQPSTVSYPGYAGSFAIGGMGRQGDTNGGGGGGWFGGAGSSHAGGFNSGGSSYISGHNGCVGIDGEGKLNSSSASKIDDSYSYTGFIFKNTKMIDGKGYSWTNQVGSSVVKMPSHENGVLVTGNQGNGFARVTFIK